MGPSDLSPEELFAYWAANFDALFPIAGAPAVLPAEGSNIDLSVFNVPFPVKLADVWDTGFKFVTRPGHPDHKGWIQFNLSESDNGNLRLTITGNVSDISPGAFLPAGWLFRKRAYRTVSIETWDDLAKNLRAVA